MSAQEKKLELLLRKKTPYQLATFVFKTIFQMH